MTKTICLSPILLCLLSTFAIAKEDEDVAEPARRAELAWRSIELYSREPNMLPDNFGKESLETAQECRAAVNRRVLAGADENTTRIYMSGLRVPLAKIRTEYCEKLAALAEGLDDKIRAAKQEKEAKLTAPFRAAGLRGDKLQFSISAARNGDPIFGVGGERLTPAQIKRARLLFVTTVDNSGYWTVYRFVFKGDRQVARTHETYAIRPGSSKFR